MQYDTVLHLLILTASIREFGEYSLTHHANPAVEQTQVVCGSQVFIHVPL